MSESTARPATTDRDLQFLRFASSILERRRLVLRWAAGGLVLAVVLGLLSPRNFVSRVTLSPLEASSGASGLAGVAAQFGVRLPTGGAGPTPEFYAELLTSRAVLFPVIDSTYDVWVRDPWWRGGDSTRLRGTLADLLEVEAPAGPRRTARAMGVVVDRITVTTDAATGLLEYAVRMPSPALARAVAARILAELTRFNVSTHQSQAAAERRFVDARLTEARRELAEAEGRLQRFLQQNRVFTSSPQLQFEHDRLQREVGLRQSVVTSLTQSFEQARINEVRDTPVFTVIESPDLPASSVPRRLVMKGLLGFTLGAVIAVFLVFAGNLVRHTAALEPDAYEDFTRQRNAVADEWRSRLAAARRLWRRRSRP